jgi:hypothetical protein
MADLILEKRDFSAQTGIPTSLYDLVQRIVRQITPVLALGSPKGITRDERNGVDVIGRNADKPLQNIAELEMLAGFDEPWPRRD